MSNYRVILTLKLAAIAEYGEHLGVTRPVAVQTARSCVALLCSGFNKLMGSGSFVTIDSEEKVLYTSTIEVTVKALEFTPDHDFQAAIVAAEDVLNQDLEKIYQSFPMLQSVDCEVDYRNCIKEVLSA